MLYLPTVSGTQLREARRNKGWTQQEAARRLGVTQAYLSMLESGRRPLPRASWARFGRTYNLPPTALPIPEVAKKFNPSKMANDLAALRYPGFSYLKGTPSTNPASVLLDGLRQHSLEPRLARALPWLVFEYPNLNWDWLLPRAKADDLQNRLGFVVTLARRLAERLNQSDKVKALIGVEASLERARLVKEDTFCRDSMTESERRWLRSSRPDDAKHWNVLTNVDAEQLASVG